MKDSVQPFAVGDSGIIYSYTKNITSLKENENKYKLTVFPNPTNSFITIESQKMEAIEIINIQGKIISNEDAVSSNSIKMSLGKCLPGLYLVKILYEDDSVRFIWQVSYSNSKLFKTLGLS